MKEHRCPQIDDQTVARMRWCVGMVTGYLIGFMHGAGRAGVTAHPWRTLILCAVAFVLLMLDWLVLDDDFDGGPHD